MHPIEYRIPLTGSKLFDIVMYNTAMKLCEKYPGLSFKYDNKEILIYGELNDYWYQQYQEAMFYNEANQ